MIMDICHYIVPYVPLYMSDAYYRFISYETATMVVISVVFFLKSVLLFLMSFLNRV